MANTKNENIKYFTGYGVGTALSPVLLSIFDANITSFAKWSVWGIGATILAASIAYEKFSKK